jgi:glycosyltransferase involved in cell wall biosynthesis
VVKIPTHRVLLVEPAAAGHHFALYVRHVVRGLYAAGCEVSLLTTKMASEHPSFTLIRSECQERLRVFFLAERPPIHAGTSLRLYLRQLSMWFELHRMFKSISNVVRPDIVYIPTMDWLVKAIECLGSPFGSTPFVGLYMSPTHHRDTMGVGPPSRQDTLYRWLFQRLLKTSGLRKLIVIDEVFYQFCQITYGALMTKVRYAPDFGEISTSLKRDECRNILDIPNEKTILLVYGALTRRKGIEHLLKIFSSDSVPSSLVVLLAGSPSKEILALIESSWVRGLLKDGRVITRLTFHDDSAEALVFRASDLVWLGYSNGFYGSSGVLYQAVSAKLPVIAMQDGLIGYLVKKYSLGVTVNPEDTASINAGLENLLNSISSKHTSPYSANGFSERHSAQLHIKAVLDALLY